MTTPEADSYGTLEGVTSYVKVYTIAGVFSASTNPTDARVILWIDQVSDMFNVALSDAGFTPPVSQVDAVKAIGMMVEQLVSDLCHMANSKGRFFSKSVTESGKSALTIMWEEIHQWVSSNTEGLSNLGVPRTKSTIGAIGSKGFDEEGEELAPIFQRKGFGNTFTDWTGGKERPTDGSPPIR